MANPVKKLAHYAYIDALRGLAFLAVLLIHVKQETDGLPPRLATFGAYGEMGVQLFFVISAFTLVMSYHKRKDDEAAPLSNYFIRRVARIAPLFWCGIVFYGILNGTQPSRWSPNGVGFLDFFTAFTFTHGFYPTTFNSVVPGGWSIAVEMVFYLLLPLLALRINSLHRALAAVLGAFLASLLLNALVVKFAGSHWTGDWKPVFDFYLHLWFPQQLPVFLLGIALYYLLKIQAAFPATETQKRRYSALLIITSLYIMFATIYSIVSPYLPAQFPFACAFVLLAWGLSLYPWKIVVNAPLCYLGTISFSCYLTHFVVLYRLTPLMINRLPIHQPVALLCVRYLFTLFCTAAVASLTYRFIEQPGIALGRRLIVWNEARAAQKVRVAGSVSS